MKHRTFLNLAGSLVMAMATSAVFAFQASQPFSADYTTASADGNMHMTGKIHFSPPKMRMDVASAGEQGGPMGGNMSMIVDSSTQTSYMLVPQHRMYMEFHGDKNSSLMPRMPRVETTADPCAARQDAVCKKLGTETVNGRTCDKWELTEKSGNTETYWIDQKLHFPIKTQAGDVTTEFTNIKEGPQDPSLFQIPEGYQKMDTGMMGRPRAR